MLPFLIKSGFSDPLTLEHTDTTYSYPHTEEALLVSSQLSTGGGQEPRHPHNELAALKPQEGKIRARVKAFAMRLPNNFLLPSPFRAGAANSKKGMNSTVSGQTTP